MNESVECKANSHGTHHAYSKRGCRCPEARRARKLYLLQSANGTYDPVFVNSIGTKRRIQALHRLGWPKSELAKMLGIKPHCIKNYLYKESMVRVETAKKISDMYDKLMFSIPPDTEHSKRIKKIAINKRWAPPLAWDNIDDPNEVPQGRRRKSRS